jgi:hypothetical protein
MAELRKKYLVHIESMFKLAGLPGGESGSVLGELEIDSPEVA